MRKLILVLALGVAVGLMSVSCSNSKNGDSSKEATDSTSATITADEVANPNQRGGEKSVFGVTLDRAMNSIVIVTEKGDTLGFGYANVDDRHNFASSNIGDSVTIKYVVVNNEDSVTAIMRGKHL